MNSYKRIISQYNNIIISLSIFLFIGVCVYIGLIPGISSIGEMKKNAEELSRQIEVLSQKASLLESIDEEGYKNYLVDLSLAVPSEKSLTSLFATIDGLSRTSGVLLSDFKLIKPGPLATSSAKLSTNEERKTGSNFLPFTLKVTGDYDQLRKFVTDAVKVRRFFRIRYFSMKFDEEETMSVSMGMDAYYAPLPTYLGSTSEKLDMLNEDDLAVIEKIMQMPVLGKEESVDSASRATSVESAPREDPFSL